MKQTDVVVPSKFGSPKWKKRIIKDDYFGDVPWWICNECEGLPNRREGTDCRCSCKIPKGQCTPEVSS